MHKLLMLSSIFIMLLSSMSAHSHACDISGMWRHSAKPATLFINLDKGEISVQSHEVNPKSIGLVVLKELELNSEATRWRAKMYSAADNDFVSVQVIEKNCEQLTVSYNNEAVLMLLR